MSEPSESFRYAYSAKQQAEVRQIQDKYRPREESKLDRLRRLDASAARPGRIAALTAGILGTLALGVGMCCTMVWAETMFFPGIAIGMAGIALLIAAHPLCRGITRRRRAKLAPEILKLTEELLQ
ncbi:MAG: hypothetical protein HFF17_00580 [Oscillospiraceae bacterium]|nr:hypothetical protein [Oscillospiraceae bacterium]